MSDKQQLAPGSAEFGRLEYFLQLSLKASTARILGAWTVYNPHLSSAFERKAKDGLVLDCWIDSATMVNGNTEDDVAKRGLTIPENESGIKVYHGALPPAPRQSLSHAGEAKPVKHSRKIMLCKVAVGRALATANEQTAAQETLPEGYDSFYLSDCFDANKYAHNYFVKSGAQILPQYILQFEYDSDKERRSREKARCDNCESNVATVFCAADAANLCRGCDEKLHTANKLASRHIRTPIGKGVDVYGTCRIHQDKMVEFFCSECHVPVCVYCKMVGHHSQGDNAKHKLISVTEAYEAVSKEIQEPDNSLGNRRDAIQGLALDVQSRGRAVQGVEEQLRAQIDEMYRKACADLETVIRRKMSILQGDEFELRRQLGEISRLEDFVDYQQTGGDATAFLFNWARHNQLKEELHKSKVEHDFSHVSPQEAVDVKCVGSISIVSADPAPASRKSVSSPTQKPYLSRFGTTTASVGKQSPITVGITNRLAERKNTQIRKTSEYFADAINALDDYGATDFGKDGSFSAYSGSVYGGLHDEQPQQ